MLCFSSFGVRLVRSASPTRICHPGILLLPGVKLTWSVGYTPHGTMPHEMVNVQRRGGGPTTLRAIRNEPGIRHPEYVCIQVEINRRQKPEKDKSVCCVHKIFGTVRIASFSDLTVQQCRTLRHAT